MSQSSVSTDSAERLRLEQALLHFLLEHIPDSIYFKDRQSRFLKVSRALARLFSTDDPRSVEGKTDFDFFTEEHARPAFEDEQRIITTGAPIVNKVEKETLPDGRVRWAMTTKMPLRDADGEIIGTCGISRDFTEHKLLEESLKQSNAQLAERERELRRAFDELRETHEKLKRAQAELVEAEKIQSVGRLAFGVAHEIRNPLNTLNMAVEYLERLEGEAGQATAVVTPMMREAIQHADRVIVGLMEACGSLDLHFEPVRFADVLRGALDQCEAVCRAAGVSVECAVPDDLPEVALDRIRIEEILVGIFQNAIEAMAAGGSLRVSASRHRVADDQLVRDEGLRSARRLRTGDEVLRVEIADTGPGIPEEQIGSVFDPFFTTKSTGKGTGLGLAVCRKVMELHGGGITLRNRGGESGVLVTLIFPAFVGAIPPARIQAGSGS